MVTMNAQYDGHKQCTVKHQEGAELRTDAPKDIGGEASAFSPTDLVGAALASCILTTMAMWAERRGVDLTGITARAGKEMQMQPRRIARLPVTVTLPGTVPPEMRADLEHVAHTCPVHASLHPDIDAPIEFVYAPAPPFAAVNM